jgi:hypothetical protein
VGRRLGTLFPGLSRCTSTEIEWSRMVVQRDDVPAGISGLINSRKTLDTRNFISGSF